MEVDLQHDFGGFTLDARFEVPGGLTVLYGRSGAGKTAIINAVAGVQKVDRGRVAVGGRVLLDTARGVNLPPHKRRLGYIFQEARLFPHLSVAQNLRYGRWFAPRAVRAARAEMGHVVEMLGIGHLLARRPGALSGGEKQRVAIGRALLAAPELILADEPLAALDAERKSEILPYFERLREEVKVPILYVSHAASEVARLATSVVAVAAGRVVAQGPAAQVLGDPGVSPAGAREAGAMIAAKVLRRHADGLAELAAGEARLLLPDQGLAVGRAVRVRIAAHDVILSRGRPAGLSALNILPGRVAELRQGRGPGALVAVDSAAGRILARVTQRSVAALGLAPGVDVFAVIKSVAVAPVDVGTDGGGSHPGA